jgi:branched-chain amino acid transport system permease protein
MSLLIILPILLSTTGNLNWVTFLNHTFIILIAVLGLNILTGMAGQISLGHSAFIMLGGYGVALLTLKAGWSIWLALPVSALVTALITSVVAVPAIRLKGFYVAVVTLAFFYIAQYVIRSLDITGGIHGLTGIPSPAIAGLTIKTDIQWYFFLLLITVICILASVNITRSRLGRAFLTVRDNEIAAAALGVNVPLIKLRAFFISSLFAGLAGGLLVSYIPVVRIDQFTFWDSIWYLGMIVIGGGGSTTGTVMGVVFLRLISQILHVIGASGWIPLSSNDSVYITYTIYGLAIILFVSFKPLGLISMWQKFKVNYKRWPFGL